MATRDAVRFVVGADGQPEAVQVNMEVWREIVAALEDAEDVALARAALTELEAANGDPEKAGWLRLEDLTARCATTQPKGPGTAETQS